MAVRIAIEYHIAAQPRTPFPASRDFPSRGNEKIGGTGYCVTYDTDSQSRNVLASPLGEEGHEVAKGCTRVRMIMILDVDVTAERRHYNTHRPAGDTTTLGLKGPVKLTNPPAAGRSILRTLAPKGETTHYDLCVALLLQIMFAVHAEGASPVPMCNSFRLVI